MLPSFDLDEEKKKGTAAKKRGKERSRIFFPLFLPYALYFCVLE